MCIIMKNYLAGSEKMNYQEEKGAARRYKQNYLDGFEKIIKERLEKYEKQRDDFTRNIFTDSEKCRNELKNFLGWPLTDEQKSPLPKASFELLSVENGYKTYRMQFDILNGITMTGLLFKHDGDDKKPLVLVQHGGLGTPELISGIYGDTCNYNNMLKRVFEKGVHVFAPQLLLWSDEYDVPFTRSKIDARLKMVGSSVTAIEIFGLSRILDYFENDDLVSSFGMVGLSYGGFYTLYTAALDTRIRSAISCSFFNKRDAACFVDWTWQNFSEKFDDAEIACLTYPRKLHIQIGNNDDLFDCKYGIQSFERLKKLCKDVGTDWVTLQVFDGTHEFCLDDAPIEKLVKDLTV